MKMTYDELLKTDKCMITPEEAAGVLGCTAQLLRIKARDPEKRRTLGFPIMAVGNRVKIPVKGLIKFIEGGESFVIESTSDKIADKIYKEMSMSGLSQNEKEKILVRLSELIYDKG